MLDAIVYNMSLSSLLLVVTVALTAGFLVWRVRDDRAVAALGGRAPKVSIYLPLGRHYLPQRSSVQY